MYDYSNYGSPSFDGYQTLLGSGVIADDLGGAAAQPVAEEGSDFFAGSTETDGLELYTYSALSLTSMAAGASDPVAALVNEMSLNFLGRPCTSAEIDAYLYSIRNSGQTLPAIGVGMVNSSESQRYLADQAHTPVINAIFRLYFGRDADPAGLAGCLESMRSGASAVDIANWCAGWPESQNHFADLKNEPIVRSIFRVFFGHEPAPDQMAPTLAAMRNGTTRQDFANWAAAWPESQQYLAGMDHIAIVNSIFREYFGREGEIGNVATVAGWMDAGASAADIANWAAGWPESENHFADEANAPVINAIYQLYFGVDVDPTGLAGCQDWMRNGASAAGISNFIGGLDSAKLHLANSANEPVVRAIFRLYFGREADATSLAFCLDTLKNGASLTDVMNWAAAWPESSNFFTSVYGNNGPTTVNADSLDAAARAKIAAWQGAVNSNAPEDVINEAYADAFLALAQYKDYVGTLGMIDFLGKPFASRPYTVLGSSSVKYGLAPYQPRQYAGELYPGEHLIYYLGDEAPWIYREPGYFTVGFVPGVQRWPAPRSVTLQQILTEKALQDNVVSSLTEWIDAETALSQTVLVTQQQVDNALAELNAANGNDAPLRQQEYDNIVVGFSEYQAALLRVTIGHAMYEAARVAQTVNAVDGSNDQTGDGIGDLDFDSDYLEEASPFGNSDEMVWVPDERDEDGNVISTGYLTWADAVTQNPTGSSAFDDIYLVQQRETLEDNMEDIVSNAIQIISDMLSSLTTTLSAMWSSVTSAMSDWLDGIYSWADSALQNFSNRTGDGFDFVYDNIPAVGDPGDPEDINGGGCFVKGTLVHCKDGIFPIETIAVGDWVASRSESNIDAPIKFRRVVETFIRQEKAVFNIQVEHANGAFEVILATAEHPFYIVDSGWHPAIDMRVGDKLDLTDGACATVASISNVKGLHTVFNFTVDEDHTYFVGQKGIWVHNTSNPPVSAQHVAAQTVKITYADGSSEIRKGEIPWRDNNPGDIKALGDAQARYGAIGVDNGFLVFGSLADGERAMQMLVQRKADAGMTIKTAIESWAPASDNNNTQLYLGIVTGLVGLPKETRLSSLTSAQLDSFREGIKRAEGFYHTGTITRSPPTP